MKFVYTFKQNVDTKQQYKEKKFSLRCKLPKLAY